ncbi:hypothetical protein DNTS_025267 [Danionella cerebrum]|uniref:Uncharacterized protein n=1 Tax=Danionella cerebrum TaxID=2873325 RepID=A0A553Q1G3_9TELE|nr:hypothetical protein DNTS_025267 [Danionella translucida]
MFGRGAALPLSDVLTRLNVLCLHPLSVKERAQKQKLFKESHICHAASALILLRMGSYFFMDRRIPGEVRHSGSWSVFKPPLQELGCTATADPELLLILSSCCSRSMEHTASGKVAQVSLEITRKAVTESLSSEPSLVSPGIPHRSDVIDPTWLKHRWIRPGVPLVGPWSSSGDPGGWG